MKNKILLSALCLLATTTACQKKKSNAPDCTKVFCTTIASAVSITVKDHSGNDVKLDSYYSIDTRNGDTAAKSAQKSIISSTYLVVGDDYLKNMYNSTVTFYFVGIKNGAPIVDQYYNVSGDCCHVHLASGNTNIIVN